MKKGYLKKQSKDPRTVWQNKVDRALQDWFRSNDYDVPCESCQRRYHVVHHHIPKSMSYEARYDHRNLIHLCSSCHFKLHAGDSTIVATYSMNRGREWVEEMNELKYRKGQRASVTELKEIYKRYV